MKTMIKYLIVFILGVSLYSCSEGELTLEQLATESIEFEKQKVSPTSHEFAVMIPKSWDWKNEDYSDEHILLAIDAGSPSDADGYIDLVSIQKLKSFGDAQDLESEYKYLLSVVKSQPKGSRLVESGKTDVLNYPAYFIHYKSDTGTYGETESIVFIVESKETGVFYHLNAGASQTKELRKNLSILIQSLKTFKMK